MRNYLLLALCLVTGLLSAQTVDSVTLRRVDSLLQVVSTLQSNREFDRALLMIDQIQSFIVEKTGRESRQSADCLIRRGAILIAKNDLNGAEKWFLEAEGIHKRALGEMHPDYFRVLYGLGAFVYYRSNDSLCESYLTRAKAFLEKTNRRKQVEYSRVLVALGNFYSFIGNLAKAEAIMLESLTSIEGIKGKENADYTLALDNLARIHTSQFRFQDAIDRLTESRNIKVKTVGKGHPDYANTLLLLGNNYSQTGDFEQVEPLYQEALNIIEAAFGRDNVQYAAALESTAIFFITVLDDFEKGEQLMASARDISANLPNGKNTFAYFTTTKNLASLYLEMGEFKKSESLYQEASTFFAAADKENFDYLSLRLNMGILYNKQQRFEAAEQVWSEVMSIEKQRMGTETLLYAKSCLSLGNTFYSRGVYAEAEKYLLESARILERILGKENLIYGESLGGLAKTYYMSAQYERAEQYYLEMLQLHEKVAGKQHSKYLFPIEGLARLYEKIGQQADATEYWQIYNQLMRQQIEKSLTYMSEQQMLAYLKNFKGGVDAFYGFAQQYPTPQHCAIAYDNNLLINGLLLENIRRLATESKRADSLTQKNFIRWQNSQRYLAAQYAKPLAERKRVAETEAETQNLEKELIRRLSAFAGVRHNPHWQEVQKKLRPNEAALEYMHYNAGPADSTVYAALLLLPGIDAPKFIPLFKEKQLTALLKTEGSPQPIFYNDLYDAGKKGDQLYDLIWKPIASALPQGTTIYCSPSGLLHRLNLGAIPTPDGKTITEKFQLTTLGSTRQLVIPTVPAAASNATAQLYGGIQYNATPAVAANPTTKSEDLESKRGPDFTQNDSTLRGENWGNLLWTKVEISAAANIMKSKDITPILKEGTEATEESFKALGEGSPSPRILHLATHGFFFPDPKESKPNEGQAIGERTFKVSDNPMIRSGLVLAGGNHAWKTGKPLQPGLEDGILTAYEISQMNLANTELVVLSACETGLGDLVGNEGVYGLQRAFKIAGAKYLVMSLWQVPDFQTQVFMTAFYKHWLERRMAVPEAFRATQAELRGKYSGEAFKWAGFVLVE